MPFSLAILGTISLIFTSCSPAPAEMSLTELLERHTKARGGAAAIENIQSLVIDLEIMEPDFTVTGQYVATCDGAMRIDVFADGVRVFTEALGPDGGWQMFGDGTVADLSSDGKAGFQNGACSATIGTAFGSHLGNVGLLDRRRIL